MRADQILDVKGRDVAWTPPESTVTEALATLAERNVGALIISIDGIRVDGILSERDIVRRLARDGADALGLPVSELMQAEVATCAPSTDTSEIMNVMTQGRFRHMPVISDGHLAGVISIGDVVKVRIDELATETEQLVGYIRDGR